MASIARYQPRPIVTFTPVSLTRKYQHRRMKDMLRSCLGNPPGGASQSFDPAGMTGMRGLGLNGLSIPGSATSEGFPGGVGAGGMGFGTGGGGGGGGGPPLSAGLDGAGSRRGSSAMGMGGGAGAGRMIAPGHLPGRKGSLSGGAGMGVGVGS